MDDLKRQKYVGRQISREEALAGIEVCKYCELPQAPRKLPDKYFHEEFCWRLRAPGSSLEAADMRECLDRLYARQNATQALLGETSERYLQTIHGLEARLQAFEPKPGYMSCPQPGSGGSHSGDPCIVCGFRFSDD